MSRADKLRERREALREAGALRDAWAGKTMPEDVGGRFSDLTQKAQRLDRELEETLPGVRLPGGVAPLPTSTTKHERERRSTMSHKAVKSPGEAFAESSVYHLLKSDGWPRGNSPKVEVPSFSTKAIPTLSTSNATTFPVVEPDRYPGIVRLNEFEKLRLRDVVSVMPTSSDTVHVVRTTSDRPEAAEGVPVGEEKPESTLALNVATVPVRTIAVWMPVAEQQLEDTTQLQGIIDEFLRFDISRFEEYEMVWGDGTTFLGIMETPNVDEFTRTVDVGAGSTTTLLDEIRGAISDVMVDGHAPDSVVLHPYDAELLSTSKGSDDHYLNQVFPTQAGGLRLWSLQIVETLAAESYRDGLGTHQRVVLVGDFRRGATLWDRNRTTVEVGYIDRQFVENIRTLRAETREAFAVLRPSAFRYIETVAAAS